MPKLSSVKLKHTTPDLKDRRAKIKFAVICAVTALAVTALAFGYIHHQQVTRNPRLVSKIDKMIKDGNCKVSDLNTVDLSKYDTAVRAKALNYLMQCDEITSNYTDALTNALKLKQLYITTHNSKQQKFVESYIQNIQQSIQDQKQGKN